MTTTKWTTCF